MPEQQPSPPLNTHAVGWIGLLSVVLGTIADPSVQSDFMALWKDLAADGPHLTWLQGLRITLRALVLLGAVAAYLGRPKTVP